MGVMTNDFRQKKPSTRWLFQRVLGQVERLIESKPIKDDYSQLEKSSHDYSAQDED